MPKVVPEYKKQARSRILGEARKMFSERGLYRTRMEDIASSMGVSKGAIYQYFRSKRELFFAVLDYHAGVRENVLQSFLQRGGLEALCSEEFFDSMYEESMGSLVLSQDLVREALADETLRKLMTGKYELWVKGLAGLLDQSLEAIEVSKDLDTESLARGILALRDGLYSSLQAGVNIRKAKRAWAVTMRGILRDVLP
jgi:AcrR family transcriptional regulator